MQRDECTGKKANSPRVKQKTLPTPKHTHTHTHTHRSDLCQFPHNIIFRPKIRVHETMDTVDQHQDGQMRGTACTTASPSVSVPFQILANPNPKSKSCRKVDVSPVLPRRSTSTGEKETLPTALLRQHESSQSPKSTACDLSLSLPKIPTRKASLERTTPTAPSSSSSRPTPPVPLLVVTFDHDDNDPRDDHTGHDTGRKEEEQEEDLYSCSSSELRESSSSFPTLFLQRRRNNMKPNRVSMSERVGSLKRAGTSYRLNQREDMEYQHHGRRRSAPAGTVGGRIPGHGVGRSRRNSKPSLFDGIASAAAIVAEIDCDAGDGDEEEDIEDAIRARDRILRTTSLDFEPSSAFDLKM